MHWPGIEPGNSKELALSFRLDRRFQRLLKVIAFGWPDLELTRFPLAEYREDYSDVLVTVLDQQGKEDRDLYATVDILAEEDDAETYLAFRCFSERHRGARCLAEHVQRRRELRMAGSWVPKPEDLEWLARVLPLSQVESMEPKQQLARTQEFLSDTAKAIESSGILDVQFPRRGGKKSKEGEE